MKSNLKLSILMSFLLALFMLSAAIPQAVSTQKKTITGRISCVNESREEIPCSADTDRFALVTESGERYFFLPEDSKSRIFADSRVRDRKLEVRVWERQGSNVEVIKVFSIKEGRKYEIQYFCSVCNITAFVGGACWCCQQEFEFREVPVE